jgi:4-hydroxy-2-oxoheptanedioate aldolase
MPLDRKHDVFLDDQGRPRVVRGTSIVSGAARLAELAGLVGFDTVWIELEHGPLDYERAEALCMAAHAGGSTATLRISSVQRQHVLRALEVGADIVVAPMVNTEADARQLVRHGKSPPQGQRGYNTRSRGMNYGLYNQLETMAKANSSTHLIAQIETIEAVGNVDAILAVEGLSGILIGPGDLSTTMDCTSDMTNAKLIEAVVGCITKARAAGRHAGIMVGPGAMRDAALDAGVDLIFIGGDIADLVLAWPKALATVDAKPRK